MTPISATQLANVRVHGLGLTDDFLLSLSDRAQTAKVDGATPASYDLPPKMPLEEAILDAWDDARKAWTRSEQYRTDPWAGWVKPLLKTLDYSFSGGGATGGKYAVRYLSETGDVPLHYTPPVMQGGELKAADLDRVTLHGTLRASPHGLMQGYLNATPEHLWGLVTNGEVLRVLRDNAQVTRPAYAEFNIGEMMRTEDARTFRVLYLLLHRSRLKGAKGSILEGWNTQATSEGVKARDSLRDGVKRAIEHLGTGFLDKNPDLYEKLKESSQAKTDLYRACLNMVYQLVFLFVTEDRDLLFEQNLEIDWLTKGKYLKDAAIRERAAHYLTRAMRAKAATLTGTNTHTDAYAGWERLLGYVRVGFAPLGLPALGSHLFQPNDLTGLRLGNQAFYAALRALSEITVDNQLRPVNYAGLDSEELGSIYESLLELVPRAQPGPRFELQTLAGNERKTTGSYYTPTGLINLLLDSALEPVIEDAIRDKLPQDAIAALKSLKIIDPACGSGHFLIAAARRVGARLAELEEETSQPSPAAQRKATRTVIAHCIYGADINPMAIELAKVALWLESQDAGKPLAFLDHRLRVGNSLLGTTPELMKAEDEIPEKMVRGVLSRAVKAHTLHLPDDAFSAIEGDDRKVVSELKKRNKKERDDLIRAAHGAQTLFSANDDLAPISAIYRALDKIEPERLENVQAQESTFAAIRNNQTLKRQKLLADVWCAAFVAPKVPDVTGITTATLNALKQNPDAPALADVRVMAQGVAEQYKFLHPHIEFPDVFTPEQGGFDCVLGNPPWDMVEINDSEFFSADYPSISTEDDGDKRKDLIENLRLTDLRIYNRYHALNRELAAFRHYSQSSGRYIDSSVGRINLYPIFFEMGQNILSESGYLGMVLPTAISTSVYNSQLFSNIIKSDSLRILIDFTNVKNIFDGIHNSFRFSIFCTSKKPQNPARFAFLQISTDDVFDNLVRIERQELELISPITLSPPLISNPADFRLIKEAVSRVPLFLDTNSWNPEVKRMHSLSDGKGLFSKKPIGDDWQMLYSGKMIHQYNHTFASFATGKWIDTSATDLVDPKRSIRSAYFVKRSYHEKKLKDTNLSYHIGYRDIARSSDERTAISVILPFSACDTTLRNISSSNPKSYVLVSIINSFIFDYFTRLKVSDVHLNASTLKQLPILAPAVFSPDRLRFITPRVLELTLRGGKTDF